ncbi:hypothetical protein BBK82_31480 [Lentzea guizhouensis]|uniref:NYN domain-containing protein n=1 Tax=Lentzea guizhouensis TaxID=1586287 RepID=A0A1B2HQB9_9PSEU|nr:hypothetical protein [Lentzea guizhouensis]ANZ39892.1 hypothetical protein BBK82_31480 [Lentzea guizhouensis]
MDATDKVLLIDVENAVGPNQPRPRVLRTRVSALVAAAGPVHHVMASYSHQDAHEDFTLSVLAELGVAAWRVPRHANAAEHALLCHARYAHQQGCRSFAVASADRAFTALGDYGDFEVLIWEDQPVSARLQTCARQVVRVPRPVLTPVCAVR